MARTRSILLFACAACLGFAVQVGPSFADKRVALVIGNANYKHTAALANTVNDANDIAASLRSLGFEVIFGGNLDRRSTEDALQRFARLARGADAALFFYAGHGMQFGGRNYLMPVDAELEDEISLRYEMTPLDEVRDAILTTHGPKIIVLDACRNNPLADQLSRSITSKTRDVPIVRGFSPVAPDDGMLIEYSTQPSQVADDGAARNSPFTTALLARLAEPGLEIGTMFRRIGNDVYKATNGAQSPEMSISLHSDFILNRTETDAAAWASLRGSNNRAGIQDFLIRFPASPYADAARLQLKLLERQATATDATRLETSSLNADRAAPTVEAQASQGIERDPAAGESPASSKQTQASSKPVLATSSPAPTKIPLPTVSPQVPADVGASELNSSPPSADLSVAHSPSQPATPSKAGTSAVGDPRQAWREAKLIQRAYGDELHDYAIAPTTTIRAPNNRLRNAYEGPTPTTILGAQTIATRALRDLLAGEKPPVLIDVLGGNQNVSLPNAIWLRGAGLGSSIDDDVQVELAGHLEELTHGDKSRPIAFFCLSKTCWLSHNACVRAVALGYSHVFWYRGGRNAWIAAGLPMQLVHRTPF